MGKCYQDPDVAGRPSLASTYTGVEASLKVATDALSEHQPIDGFLGRHNSCMHAWAPSLRGELCIHATKMQITTDT